MNKYDNIEEQREWNNPDMWENDGEEWSEFFGNTENLWNTIIYPKIKKYLRGDILEIAPGYGRITELLLNHVDSLTVVDLNENCIIKCKERFGNKIKYHINDGKSLDMILSNTLDFVISWDSFVHMNSIVIDAYLKEIHRTLKPNTYCVIHHSHFKGNKKSFKNIAGRSSMTPDLFKKLVEKNNLTVVNQEGFNWTISDTITTIHKK